MRVLQLNKYFYPPHLGGIEQSLLMLSRELASREGTAVTAIVANEGSATVRETVEGVDVLRVGRLLAYASTPIALGYRRALRREALGGGATAPVAGPAAPPADVVHMHFPYPWGEVAWLSSGLDTPSVLTYHSDIVRQRFLGTLYGPVLRRVLDRVDRIVVGSPQMIEISPFLAPHAAKCRVVPFAIDTDTYAGTAQSRVRAEQLRAGHQRPIVLFVGRFVYYKGVHVLLEAMRPLDADLVLIGSGPLEAEMREYCRATGIADRVTFVPPQPLPELVAWYHAADVFCLPSVAASEAYGLVQLEAHAAGTPVVSTRLPTGVPFVNEDGVTGLTVPVGDADALARALRTLLSDDALRARLGAAARDRALTQFTVPRMVDRIVDVYDEAVSLKGRGRR